MTSIHYTSVLECKGLDGNVLRSATYAIQIMFTVSETFLLTFVATTVCNPKKDLSTASNFLPSHHVHVKSLFTG